MSELFRQQSLTAYTVARLPSGDSAECGTFARPARQATSVCGTLGPSSPTSHAIVDSNAANVDVKSSNKISDFGDVVFDDKDEAMATTTAA